MTGTRVFQRREVCHFPRNHFISSDTFPAEVVEAMKKDLESLVGKRVRIQMGEPIEFFGPWGWGDLFGRVVSQYVDYEGSSVLEIELDFEVDWERGKGKQVIVASRYTDERSPGGYYPSWEGTKLLSLLEGKEVTVNVYLTKYRLTTRPPENPDLVAFGSIRVIEEESWMKLEEEKEKEKLEELDRKKKRNRKKKTRIGIRRRRMS
ncbi:MAG: hypothetical protein ACE5IJ_08275 [Thermoplasmata archaeon]